jgi:hypothetical protein
MPLSMDLSIFILPVMPYLFIILCRGQFCKGHVLIPDSSKIRKSSTRTVDIVPTTVTLVPNPQKQICILQPTKAYAKL